MNNLATPGVHVDDEYIFLKLNKICDISWFSFPVVIKCIETIISSRNIKWYALYRLKEEII